MNQRRLHRAAFQGRATLTLGSHADGDDHQWPVTVIDLALAGALVEASGDASVLDALLPEGRAHPRDERGVVGTLEVALSDEIVITLGVRPVWWRYRADSVDSMAERGHPAESMPGCSPALSTATDAAADQTRRSAGSRLIGLELRSIDPESAAHLRRLVELNLGDASLLERDFSMLAGAVEPSRSLF